MHIGHGLREWRHIATSQACRERRKSVEGGKFDPEIDRVDPQIPIDGSKQTREFEQRDRNAALLGHDRMERGRRRTDSPTLVELDRGQALVILIYEGVEKVEGDPTDHAFKVS
jgi:hypothetical protein